jgi:hypothetical protein
LWGFCGGLLPKTICEQSQNALKTASLCLKIVAVSSIPGHF